MEDINMETDTEKQGVEIGSAATTCSARKILQDEGEVLSILARSNFGITPDVRRFVSRSISVLPRDRGYWLGLKPSRVPILLSRRSLELIRPARGQSLHRRLLSVFGIRMYSWFMGLLGFDLLCMAGGKN
jgi:hypothetical protein